MEKEMSNEATELFLYLTNDGQLYERWYKPIVKNMMMKKASGKYDDLLAVKGFLYLVDAAAKKYVQEHGTHDFPWNKQFPRQDRIDVAIELVKQFESEVKEGSWQEYIPKKYQQKEPMKLTKEHLINTIEEVLEQQRKYSTFKTPVPEDKELEEMVSFLLGKVEPKEIVWALVKSMDPGRAMGFVGVAAEKLGIKFPYEEEDEEVVEEEKESIEDFKKELPKTYVDKNTGKRKESNPYAILQSQEKKEK